MGIYLGADICSDINICIKPLFRIATQSMICHRELMKENPNKKVKTVENQTKLIHFNRSTPKEVTKIH